MYRYIISETLYWGYSVVVSYMGKCIGIGPIISETLYWGYSVTCGIVVVGLG